MRSPSNLCRGNRRNALLFMKEGIVSISEGVVVITGATGGLGRVVAQRFAEAGASLALLSSNQEKLDEMADTLAIPPQQIMTHSVDLRDAMDVQRASAAVLDRFGAIHVLLHLVGGWTGGKTLVEMNPDDLKQMMEQHVWTTFHLIQYFIPHLTNSGWGRVVVVSSPVAVHPPAKMGAYAVAKAAEDALVLTLAEEAKAHGVTANILQVRTIDVEHKRKNEPSSTNASWSTPEEIAAMMLYLCSGEAGMVNGARLPLFGKGG